MRVESDLSSSGFPASFFTNDPAARVGGDSPTSSDFRLFDTEKAQKGLIEIQDYSPIEIRPYPLESSKYSAHSLSFDMPRNYSKSPVMVALPTTRSTSAAIIKALKKGNEKVLPVIKVDSQAPISYGSHAHDDNPKNLTSPDKEWFLIQPPPEAHLQTPSKENRLRKDTPSLMTQATGVSTNSSSHAVITLARKDPILSATARTITTSSIHSKRAPSPVDTVMPHESNPSIDLGSSARCTPQSDSYRKN